MNRFCRFLIVTAALGCFGTATADTVGGENDIEESDLQALREWIYSKRQVTIGEKGGALSISGEVRAEFQTTNETRNGVKQRGSGAPLYQNGDYFPAQAYDVEVNLMFDYRTDRTWASVKLEFDNDAGLYGGTFNKLKLERAFIGMRIIERDTYTADILLGRNRMGSYFDSKVEFGNFFDGILFRYDRSNEALGDYYIHAGAFVIDERRNHYGYVGEVGLLNIASTGLYAKYSLIDWDTKHYRDNCIEVKGRKVNTGKVNNRRFDYVVSQAILGYKFIPKKLDKVTLLYIAGLINTSANKHKVTAYKRANLGGYLGLSIGQLKRQNDWALDANYQIVQAQAIPDFDNNGIGIGNANGSGFYASRISGIPVPNDPRDAGGNVNYRGFVVTLEYLLTNNINLLQQWQQSITLDDDIGPFRRFKQYEIELIYLF